MARSPSFFILGLLTGVLACAAVFAWLAAPDTEGGGDAALVLKLADNLDVSHPTHRGLQHFATRLQELSGGAVRVDLYPSSVLGPDMQCLEQLQNGTLAMMKIGAATLEPVMTEMAVFGLPYVFSSRQHYWQVLDGATGKELLDLGQSKRLRGLCWLDAGSRNFYTVNTPIRTPADLQGLKIRVQNSPVSIAMVQQLGAAPTPIDFGELYTALAQGVVDGAENNPPSFVANKHSEVCKHFSLDGHTRIPDLLLISEPIWQGLSEQQRGWIRQAASDCTQYQRKLWADASTAALAEAREQGVDIIEPDIAAFQAACAPLLAEYRDGSIGRLLQRIAEVTP